MFDTKLTEVCACTKVDDHCELGQNSVEKLKSLHIAAGDGIYNHQDSQAERIEGSVLRLLCAQASAMGRLHGRILTGRRYDRIGIEWQKPLCCRRLHTFLYLIYLELSEPSSDARPLCRT